MTAGERIVRLERAVAQISYLHHGPRGLAMLRRQAPDAAALMFEWMNGTSPVDATFAGRETTEREQLEEVR